MKTIVNIKNFDSTIDTIITDERPKQTGTHSIEILTDNMYRLIADAVYQNQRVQSTNWNKYQLSFIATESYSVELLKNAKTITLTAFNGSVVYHVVILDIMREAQAGTDFDLITIEFFDTNLDNYKFALAPVTNFLRSDAIIERGDAANILRIYSAPKAFTFATILSITQTASQPEEQTFIRTQSGAKVATNSIIKRHHELIFYLNAEDLQLYQVLVPLADGNSVLAWYIAQGVQYDILETPTISVEPTNGTDLWKCSCSFVSSIVNHYSYE